MKKTLQAESLLFLILTLLLYFYHFHFSIVWFFVLLFVPDFSMLGYSVNPRMGSITYNFFHTYLLPLLLGIVGMIVKMDAFIMIGLIWAAHIAMDRTLGYGLKSEHSFKETHLQLLK
ncbi:DUF4260 domain-containing protein [Fictibacillus fluitans]|uniref:DUF4260 domain-containing protein n=1 Tax=Fictibacillus fluitans TaxID=3058422 RepID=A0ABT8HTE5_9BACL|nr:DUF4260 domain-containing protein [Fictibacillus sp. NE201]MDN4524055.1 DUF4260 domain-containing protein [Fictibacillus sp. NE201]